MSEINALADELLDVVFEQDPIRASLLGFAGEHDHRLVDLSATAEQVSRRKYLDIAARANSYAADRLSAQDVITRDIVAQQATAAVDHLDARVIDTAVSDGLSAPALSVLTILPLPALTDADKAHGYLSRLAAIPDYLDTLMTRQRGALAGGLAPPNFLVDGGIDYLRRYLDAPTTDPLRIAPDVSVAGFADERDRLLKQVVRPAYARYRDFLAQELAREAMPADKPGLCWLPEGQRKYAGLIKAHTTTEHSAQQLHETGRELIAALTQQYRELGARAFGTETLPDIFHRLRTDPQLRWSDAEELLDAARATVGRAVEAAPQWFSTVPAQECVVRAVPDAEAHGGTIAYYVEPALDGSRPGTYFANTHNAHERFRHTSEAIAFHEAIPGHHFQLATALDLTQLPMLRRIADINAYIEGWGLYAERLADEMGLYSSDETKLGLVTQDSMRAGRLVVDTGLHALGWSRQQAIDYLLEHTPMAPMEVEAEIDRYVANPGQALSYMVGRLEIQRVRAEAERALGDRFDIRRFHDVVLTNGILPMPVLASVVRDWVATQQ